MSFTNTSLPFPFTEGLIKAERSRKKAEAEVQREIELEEQQRQRDIERQQERQELLSQIKPVTDGRTPGEQNLIRRRNRRLLGKLGINVANVGSLQRTASDILLGKSNVPLKQVSASVRRQVELARLNKALVEGLIDPERFLAQKERAEARARQGRAEESAFRKARSVRKAQGEAAKAEEQRQLALFQSQKQARSDQIFATGAQNLRILEGLERAGASTDLTRATPRRRGRVTTNESQRQFAAQQVARPIDESRRVLTSGQINAADLLQQQPQPQDTILNDFFEPQGPQPISQSILTSEPLQPSPQEFIGPSNQFVGFIPSVRDDQLGFTVSGELVGGAREPQEQFAFSGTRRQFFRQQAISGAIEGVSEFATSVKNPVGEFVGGAVEELAGVGTSIANLAGEGIRNVANILRPEQQIPPQLPLAVPRTVTSDVIGGTIQGAGSAFQTGRPEEFFKGIQEGAKSAQELVKEQGIPRTLGQIAGFVAPISPAIARVSPIKLAPVELPLREGPTKVSTTVTAFGKPLVTAQQGKLQKGGPKTQQFPLEELQPVGRGLEIGTGASKVAQKAKQESIQELIRRGVLDPKEGEKIKTVQEIVTLGSQAPQRLFRQDFGVRPFQPLKPGRQTEAQLQFFRETKLPPIKGSFAQIPQLLPKFVRRAGDFDIDIGSVEKGAILARRNVQALQPTAGPLEKFIAVKAKVKKQTPRGEEKVGEFLTKDDVLAGSGEASLLNRVFNIKIKEKGPTVSGIGITSLQSQLLRKGASVASIRGPLTEGGTKTGLEIGPPTFRQKDVVDLFAIGKTQAFVLKEKGKIVQALQLERATEKLKKQFPDVDFNAPFGPGNKIEFGVKEPSILSSILQKGKTPTPLSQSIASGIDDSDITIDPRGQTVFHGTTLEKAEKILDEGFKLSKAVTGERTIFAGTIPDIAKGFGSGVLAVKLKKDLKVFDVNKQTDPFLPNDELRALAKEADADVIVNMKQAQFFKGQEIEIINTRAIESIKGIKGQGIKGQIGQLTTKQQKSSAISISDSLGGSPKTTGISISSGLDSLKTSILSPSLGVSQSGLPNISIKGASVSSSLKRPSSRSPQLSPLDSSVISPLKASPIKISPTSPQSPTKASPGRSPSIRSPTLTGFGEPTLTKEPRIRLGFLLFGAKTKAKKEEEAIADIGIKQFRTGTADPIAPGVIAALGVKPRIGRTSKVFVQLDKSLVRSRKKRAKFGVFDLGKPFGKEIKF